MRSSRARRHHPLAAAGAALEHLVLRHFGFHVIRADAEESPARDPTRAGGAPKS
ncbi:MAG: hypothetical protein ACXVRM_05130 [Solirubrobacteraceae bacterium]